MTTHWNSDADYAAPFRLGQSEVGLEIEQELERARRKFPRFSFDRWKCLAALTEEVGELNQACLQIDQEPEKGVTEADIRKEAIQVAVMAIRVLLDCRQL